MSRSHKISRSTESGKFVTGPLGKSKATKFSLVEGITLNQRSAKVLKSHKSKGLSGHALRTAISKSFVK